MVLNITSILWLKKKILRFALGRVTPGYRISSENSSGASGWHLFDLRGPKKSKTLFYFLEDEFSFLTGLEPKILLPSLHSVRQETQPKLERKSWEVEKNKSPWGHWTPKPEVHLKLALTFPLLLESKPFYFYSVISWNNDSKEFSGKQTPIWFIILIILIMRKLHACITYTQMVNLPQIEPLTLYLSVSLVIKCEQMECHKSQHTAYCLC